MQDVFILCKVLLYNCAHSIDFFFHFTLAREIKWFSAAERSKRKTNKKKLNGKNKQKQKWQRCCRRQCCPLRRTVNGNLSVLDDVMFHVSLISLKSEESRRFEPCACSITVTLAATCINRLTATAHTYRQFLTCGEKKKEQKKKKWNWNGCAFGERLRFFYALHVPNGTGIITNNRIAIELTNERQSVTTTESKWHIRSGRRTTLTWRKERENKQRRMKSDKFSVMVATMSERARARACYSNSAVCAPETKARTKEKKKNRKRRRKQVRIFNLVQVTRV